MLGVANADRVRIRFVQGRRPVETEGSSVMVRKILMASLLAAGTVTAAMAPADAATYYYGGYGHYGAYYGGYAHYGPYYGGYGVAAGAAAGVAVGAALGAAAAAHPVYAPPPPVVYVAPPAVYAPGYYYPGYYYVAP
jgi:hypothetical protein